MTAAVAGGPATPTEMAVVVRGPATSPVAQPVAASLVVGRCMAFFLPQ